MQLSSDNQLDPRIQAYKCFGAVPDADHINTLYKKSIHSPLGGFNNAFFALAYLPYNLLVSVAVRMTCSFLLFLFFI